ncbi:PH domain-containing protein [Jatrophihabitans sp. YIM 134969]
MAPLTVDGALPSDVPWRRLDQRMLLVAPFQELGRWAIPLVVILFTGFGDPIRTAITGAGAVALIGWGVVRYLTTTYRVTPEQVQIRRGVINRSTSVAPRDRVRSVDVTAPFLHRLLGLGKLVIGTGKVDTRRNRDLVLDGLSVADAERLRGELLHRAPTAPGEVSLDKVAAASEVELVRLRQRWLLYAPFTLSGAITGLVVVGAGSRLFNEARIDPTRFALTREAIRSLQRAPLWLDVVQIAAAVVIAVSLLSIAGYVLAFHRFRLTRRSDGTLHVSRGLITRRETTLEHKRVRGVELSEPVLLRAVGGARLVAVAVGLRENRGNERTASLLVPPSPRRIDLAVGADIVDDPTALDGELVGHGRTAVRRRFTRAVLPALTVVVVVSVLAAFGVLPLWTQWVAPLLLVAAVLLAADRARSLGHRIGGRLVVTRHGSLVRRRQVVAADGVIGAVVRSSPFQRRAGVATLHLTTAAGRQAYPFTDLETERVWDVVREVLPGGTLERP